MRKYLFAALSVLCFTFVGCSNYQASNDSLFQVSTINALMKGCYDSDMTIAQLCKKGDTGIGTFNGLDGEMFLDRGHIYQIKSDGHAYHITNSNQKTPFASTVYFKPDVNFEIEQNENLEQLKQQIEKHIDNRNAFYAVRIEGQFEYIKTRSVPAQQKPYKPLKEVVKTQPTFEFDNVNGTIVGFILPDYMHGLNVTGFHLHFLDSTKTAGGHLLDCKAQKLTVSLDRKDRFELFLPDSDHFRNLTLNDVSQEDIEKVEK